MLVIQDNSFNLEEYYRGQTVLHELGHGGQEKMSASAAMFGVSAATEPIFVNFSEEANDKSLRDIVTKK